MSKKPTNDIAPFIVSSPLAKTAWKEAALALKNIGIPTPVLDARLLLQHVLDLRHEDIIADGTREISTEEATRYAVLIERRLKREPVAQIVGYKHFWDRQFITNKNTLDPRPDSETLIFAAMQHFTDREAPLKILDLGTGTGALIITMLDEYPNATGLAVDISEEALEITRKNAALIDVMDRIDILRADWGHDILGQFDIILSNPPYIPSNDILTLEPEVQYYDPQLALDGGKDGLNHYRAMLPHVARLLKGDGRAYLEIGTGQEHTVTGIAENNQLFVEAEVKDFAGITRCLVLQR